MSEPTRDALHTAASLAAISLVCAALALAAVVGAVAWRGDE